MSSRRVEEDEGKVVRKQERTGISSRTGSRFCLNLVNRGAPSQNIIQYVEGKSSGHIKR